MLHDVSSGFDAQPGYEIDYVQITSNATSTATTEAGATEIIAGNTRYYDGATTVMIECFIPICENPSGLSFIVSLFEDGSAQGEMGRCNNNSGVANIAGHFVVRRTPSAGNHTYSIRLWGGTGTKTAYAGTGGAGGRTAAYMRITVV
jgi:hypothetical protein